MAVTVGKGVAGGTGERAQVKEASSGTRGASSALGTSGIGGLSGGATLAPCLPRLGGIIL